MKIKFLPQDVELEINPGQSVLDLAQQNDLHIQSVCKGIPSCAECRVYIKEGEHNVMPPQAKELELIGSAYFVDQRRLSCQLRCFGDVIVDLTEQVEKENKSTKNPQGRYVKERDDSQARMGNVLEELTEEEKEYEKELDEERKKSLADGSSENQSTRKVKIDQGSFYKVNESPVRNSKAKSKNQQGKSTNKSGSSSNKTKRNRNRRRKKSGPKKTTES